MKSAQYRKKSLKITARVDEDDLLLLRKLSRKRPSELVRDLIAEKAESLRAPAEAAHPILKSFGVSDARTWEPALKEIYAARAKNHGRKLPK